MKYPVIVLFAAAAILLVSCGNGGVSDPTPEEGIPATTLVLLDSIGVEIGDSNFIFGSIEGLGYAPDGNIAVLDRISADIRVYSPAGEFIYRIGGRGGGPGEMHNPSGLFIFPDGRLGALDSWRNGLQVFSADGEYQGNGMEVSSNIHMYPEMLDDSSFISLKTEFIIDEGSAPLAAVFVGLFHMTVEPEVTYWRVEEELDMSILADLAQKYFLSVSLAVDTENEIVYVSPFSGTDYRIDRFTIGGEPLPPLTMDVEPVPLTEEEMRIEEEYVRQKLTSLEGGNPQYNVNLIDPLTHRLPVTELEIAPDGNLWARRGTEDEPLFDVWSPEGELVGQVVMPGIGPGSRSWDFELSENGILAFDRDPKDFQKIYIIGIEEQ